MGEMSADDPTVHSNLLACPSHGSSYQIVLRDYDIRNVPLTLLQFYMQSLYLCLFKLIQATAKCFAVHFEMIIH